MTPHNQAREEAMRPSTTAAVLAPWNIASKAEAELLEVKAGAAYLVAEVLVVVAELLADTTVEKEGAVFLLDVDGIR